MDHVQWSARRHQTSHSRRKRRRRKERKRETDRQKKPITISICVLSSASSLESLRNLKD
jgi:hypothetical protein